MEKLTGVPAPEQSDTVLRTGTAEERILATSKKGSPIKKLYPFQCTLYLEYIPMGN